MHAKITTKEPILQVAIFVYQHSLLRNLLTPLVMPYAHADAILLALQCILLLMLPLGAVNFVSLKEKVCKQKAQQAQHGHHLHRHALCRLLLNCLHGLLDRLLLATLAALDVALAEAAVLELGNLSLGLSKLILDFVVRHLGRASNGSSRS